MCFHIHEGDFISLNECYINEFITDDLFTVIHWHAPEKGLQSEIKKEKENLDLQVLRYKLHNSYSDDFTVIHNKYFITRKVLMLP